jgi:hypothetical protein
LYDKGHWSRMILAWVINVFWNIICDADIFYSKIISDLDIFDSLITCDLWHLIFLTFLYKIILLPWYHSIAVLQTFKNDCCACIWDHWINWIELNWIKWWTLTWRHQGQHSWFCCPKTCSEGYKTFLAVHLCFGIISLVVWHFQPTPIFVCKAESLPVI